MGILSEKIDNLVAQQLEEMRVLGVRPAVIIMNEKLYQDWTTERMTEDLAQSSGYIRQGDVKSHQGLSIISSQKCKDISVF